jgi:hypothetical protein
MTAAEMGLLLTLCAAGTLVSRRRDSDRRPALGVG